MDAHVVVRTTTFDADLTELTTRCGFRVDAIFPADAPTTAIVSGHGVRLRVEAADLDEPVTVHLVADPDDADVDTHARTDGYTVPASELPTEEVMLAGGSRLIPMPPTTTYTLPPNEPTLTLSHADPEAEFGVGRAGMRYRDLIPDRWGGRFIASHIAIPDGGLVPDYVHFHKIRFQLIFVKSGWVRVVYEDQGEPFVMHAGDAVLQPPEIRHRVLEASPGLEVIEVGTPSFHETIADWSLELPNGVGDPARRWSGQRFVRHIAAEARYGPWRAPSWEQRDTGIGAATAGLADVRIARIADLEHPAGAPDTASTKTTTVTTATAETRDSSDAPSPAGDSVVPLEHGDEFLLLVVLQGSVRFHTDDDEVALTAGSSAAVPSHQPAWLVDPSDDCELLEVVVHESASSAVAAT